MLTKESISLILEVTSRAETSLSPFGRWGNWEFYVKCRRCSCSQWAAGQREIPYPGLFVLSCIAGQKKKRSSSRFQCILWPYSAKWGHLFTTPAQRQPILPSPLFSAFADPGTWVGTLSASSSWQLVGKALKKTNKLKEQTKTPKCSPRCWFG